MKILPKILFELFQSIIAVNINFEAMVKMVIFWNIFLYCRIISFLELFSDTCFLCILQTQLVFWLFFSILNLFFSMYASHDV